MISKYEKTMLKLKMVELAQRQILLAALTQNECSEVRDKVIEVNQIFEVAAEVVESVI